MLSNMTFIYFLLAVLFGSAQAEDSALTEAQIKTDLDLMWTTLDRVHPGYTRYRSQAEIEQLKTRFFDNSNEQSNQQLFSSIARFTAALGCEHTKAELPDALEQYRKKTAQDFFPFKLSIVEGRWLIANAVEGSGLQYGDEILAIDERSVKQVSERLVDYVSVDGPNFTQRALHIGGSSEILADVLNTYYGLEFPLSDRVKLKIARQGKTLNHTIQLVNYQQWLKVNHASGSIYRNFKDSVHWRMIDEKTAYLAVDTFVNYREPVNPKKMFDPIFKALKEKGVETLILDLRRNGGGSDKPMAMLLSYLSGRKAALRRAPMMKTINFNGLREHLSTWQQEYLNPQEDWVVAQPEGGYLVADKMLGILHQESKPNPLRFTGKLMVLTSKNNSSGSTAMLTYLQQEANTTLVGEMTGGNQAGGTAGIIAFLKLPNSGITVRVPLLRMRPNLDAAEDGKGVVPDVLVEPTVTDFLNKRDTVFEKAVAIASAR